MSWLYVNPFTGSVVAHNIVVYEKGSQDTAIRAANLDVNITIGKLFFKTYELSSITLDQAWANVIQDSLKMNFDDWLQVDSTAAPIHLRICNIQIKSSEIHYHQLSIPVTYFIKDVNVTCSSLQWDVDTTHVEFDFASGTGSGTVKGSMNFNKKSTAYDLQTLVSDFDLKVLEQYIKDFSNSGNFSAFMDADVHTIGNLHSKLDMMTSGKVAFRDFHFGITLDEDYVSFRKFSMNIDSLYPSDKKYFLSSLMLDSAFLKYEKYDSLDNFSRMFGVNGKLVKEAYDKHEQVNVIFLIADYLSELARNIINSEYRISELSITNSKLLFNDYSLLEKFSATTDSVAITARDLDSRKKRSYLTLQSRLIPFGNVNVKLDVNPTDFGDFHLQYALSNVPLPMFNPYFVTYTSFPFNKGAMQVNGTWNVVNKQISSVNHLSIINPSRTDKWKNEGTLRLPVPFLLTLFRDWHRTIDFNVPITGNLDNPTYHLRDVILDVLRNIFVKPPTLPYAVRVQNENINKEEHLMMEWQPMQSQLDHQQSRQLRKISLYLILNPHSHLTISPNYFESDEKETILLFEAKKNYYASGHHLNGGKLSEDDSAAISSMSIKDDAFVQYLNEEADPNGTEFSVFGKCRMLIGQGYVNEKYNKMIALRKKGILAFFSNEQQSDRVTYKHAVSVVPPSGFSQDVFKYQ